MLEVFLERVAALNGRDRAFVDLEVRFVLFRSVGHVALEVFSLKILYVLKMPVSSEIRACAIANDNGPAVTLEWPTADLAPGCAKLNRH